MRLYDLANARKEEKQLARTVGQHLAHMIRLYAQEMWEKDPQLQKQYGDWNNFWQEYSQSKWKNDGWMEKFNRYAENNLKQSITAEQIENAINMIVEKKLLDVPTMNPQQLAKHHMVSVEEIHKQLDVGVKVEMEHTKDKKVAREIALDHLKADPKYYDKHEKTEASFEEKK